MMIELKMDVRARTENGAFVTVLAGAKVNYTLEKQDGSTVHRFFAVCGRQKVEHVTVTEAGQVPMWL
jgi:hypothetical protein